MRNFCTISRSGCKRSAGTFFKPLVQPKLGIGSVDDAYEKEADSIANRIMQPDKKVSSISPLAKEETQQANSATAPPLVQSTLHSGGQPLDTGTRNFMESRIGHDFGNVRIHNDPLAHQSSATINALAYTVGNHIAFGEGKYQPHSNSGKQLLAHELTHVVQQGGKSQSLQRMVQVNKGVTEIKKLGALTKGEVFYSGGTIDKSDTEKEIITSLVKSGRIFKIKGKTNTDANTNFEKHVKARLGIIDFASKKKYSFPWAGASVSVNTEFWDLDPKTKAITVKKGKKRQKAIEDLNVNPEKYSIACGDATMLTMEGGGKSQPTSDEASGPDDWVPGDHGYIKNTKFPSWKSTAYKGENIIYTGNDQFWGHLSDTLLYKTLDEWRAEVESWDKGEELSTERGFPSAGLQLISR